MHYMVNGTTPYPLTSYYSSYAAGPLEGLSKWYDDTIGTPSYNTQKALGQAIKDTQDAAKSGNDAVRSTWCFGMGKGVNCAGGGTPTGPAGEGGAKVIDTLNKAGQNIGGASDFISKYGIYLAAGGGVLAIMMIFMMFKR